MWSGAATDTGHVQRSYLTVVCMTFAEWGSTVKKIDKYDKQNPLKVVLSSLIRRCDQNFNDDIVNINEKLQRF